jgi:PAS domain S-box-containing protein
MEALRESETYLRAILVNISEAVITIDRNARIISANPAAEKIFGYSETEIEGRQLALLIPETPECRHVD